MLRKAATIPRWHHFRHPEKGDAIPPMTGTHTPTGMTPSEPHWECGPASKTLGPRESFSRPWTRRGPQIRGQMSKQQRYLEERARLERNCGIFAGRIPVA